jgi:hypothetical protein
MGLNTAMEKRDAVVLHHSADSSTNCATNHVPALNKSRCRREEAIENEREENWSGQSGMSASELDF